MRSARLFLPLALFLVVFATTATAQSLTATPDSFYLYSAEATMDLSAGGNFGLDHNDVVFSGPGDYTMFIDGVDGSFMEVSVPTIVTITAGTWNVQVFAYDTPDGTPRVFGPASFSVVARPQTDPPLISIPENVSVAATSNSGGIATFSVSAQNLDGTPVPITCNHNSGDLFPLGATTVNCSATNDFGTTSGSFPVFVSDLTAPVLNVPADITTSNPVVTFTVTATDDLDSSPTILCSPASGSTFAPGTTTVECTAVDNFANVGVATFTVTVVTGPPTLTLPADITAEATSPAGAVVTYTATADENATVVCNPPSGSTFALGTTTVNCSATNILNQTTTGSFHVTVVDTTPPSITSLTANPASLWPDDHKMVNVTITGTATDLVDTNPTLTILSVTSDQPATTNHNQNQSPDWVITGPMTLQLRRERSNGQDRTYTITVKVTDFSGNSSTATMQVKVTQNNNGNH
jgi:HYR domain-containing protein